LGKVPANNLRKQTVDDKHKLSQTDALVRKTGDVSWDGLKMKVKINPHNLGKYSKNNCGAAMHHFRFDKWLKDELVCCQIPCFCQWCVTKYDKHGMKQYEGAQDGCKLWPIIEIMDKDGKGTGNGYNNWRFGTFVEGKKGVTEQYHTSLRDMNIKIGKRYLMEIDTGNYGAYMIENPIEPRYVVRWKGIPWQATSDGFSG
jgi:hypothetical protein